MKDLTIELPKQENEEKHDTKHDTTLPLTYYEVKKETI
jgi:hypothetical protein